MMGPERVQTKGQHKGQMGKTCLGESERNQPVGTLIE